jgi:hypothetical protein
MAVVLALIGFLWFIGFVTLGIKGSDTGFSSRSTEVLIGALVFSVFGLVFGYFDVWYLLVPFQVRIEGG